jgi:hypothetical protein
MPQNTPKDAKWLLRRVDELEKRIKTLETAPRSGNTSVSHGKFLIQDGNVELLRAGYLGPGAGGDIRGIMLRRPTGELAFATWTGAGTDNGGFWTLYDKQGNTIFSDDVVSGQGIARPLIGAPVFAPQDTTLYPAITSSSYFGVWFANWYKQQPTLQVEVWTRSDSGTSGDIRVSCNGATASQAIGSADNTVRSFILAPPGAFLSFLQINIEMRRTSGTGFLSGWPMAVYGGGS